MLKVHWKTWTCPFGCALSFRTSENCRRHAHEVHPTQVSTGKVENLVALSSNSDPKCAEGKCPLCLTFDIKDSRTYESHVGKHLEQLSLFVLPQIDGDESEQDEGTILPQLSDDESEQQSEQQSEQEDRAEDDQHGYMNLPCGLVHGCHRPRVRFQDGRQAIHCDLHIPCAKSGQPEGCLQIAAPHSGFCFAHKCSLEGCADDKESSSLALYCRQHTCHRYGCHQAVFDVHSIRAKYCSAHKCSVDNCFYEVKVESSFCHAHACAHSFCKAAQLPTSLYCHEHCCRHDKCSYEALYRNGFCRSHSCVEKGCTEPRLGGRENIRQCLQHWTRDIREAMVATGGSLPHEEPSSGSGSASDLEPEEFRPQHAGPSNPANTDDALIIDERVRELNDIKDDPDDDRAHSTHGIDGGHEGSHSRRGGFNPYELERKPERSQKAMLSKALKKANIAVELDNAQVFQGARLAYREACDLLHRVILLTAGEDKEKLEAIVSPFPRLPSLLLP